jgi:hypothetical protein
VEELPELFPVKGNQELMKFFWIDDILFIQIRTSLGKIVGFVKDVAQAVVGEW